MRLILWLLRLSGFTNLYALVPVAEWRDVQSLLSSFREGGTNYAVSAALTTLINDHQRTRQIAEEAHTMSVGALPVSRVVATKIEGTTVVAGLPDDPDPSKYMTKK